jgi:manganese transport protein
LVGQAAKPVKRVVAKSMLLGPAFVAAIAYVDPGNVASNVSAGAGFGYLLVWVIVASNAMAGLVQYLSAKLGVVTGATLPELVGDRLARPARLAYWAQAEFIAMATDLAEVVGGAIALQLLFGLPLLLGGAITGMVSMAVLLTQNRAGQRHFERVIIALMAVLSVGFVAGVIVAPPSPAHTLTGLLPRFEGTQSVLLAVAILGATVMPHVVYLHSGLVRDRFGHQTGPARHRLLKATRVDVASSMTIAGLVNLAMLLLAARNLSGRDGIDSIQGAHHAIATTLGPTIGVLFALALLASGLASTAVGAYAGSMIMQGLLDRQIPRAARRIITLIPALLILAVGVEPTRVLVFSQVLLSFGLPFALIPLVWLTSRRAVMGGDANHRATTTTAATVTVVIVALNTFLIYQTLTATS